jgi:hypothetical protein
LQRRPVAIHTMIRLGSRRYCHAKIPSVALPNGDTPSDFSASALNELYVEIRKREELFLYILVVGITCGNRRSTWNSSLMTPQWLSDRPIDGKAGLSASMAMHAYGSRAVRSASSRARSGAFLS